MKNLISLTFLLLSKLSFCQIFPRLDLKFKVINTNSTHQINYIDTIYLRDVTTATTNMFTNLRQIDTSFIIHNLNVGKYILYFKVKDYTFNYTSVSVCSKCENFIALIAYPKNTVDISDIFTLVESNPKYTGGNKSLSTDFLRGLDKKEKRLLKSTSFTIKAFVTKGKELSDINISPKNSPSHLLEIILKGLSNLKNWKPAMTNGIVVDGIIDISSSMILTGK